MEKPPHNFKMVAACSITSAITFFIASTERPDFYLLHFLIGTRLKWGNIQMLFLIFNFLFAMYTIALQKIKKNEEILHLASIITHLMILIPIIDKSGETKIRAPLIIFLLGSLALVFAVYSPQKNKSSISIFYITLLNAFLFFIIPLLLTDPIHHYFRCIKNIDNSVWVFIPSIFIPIIGFQLCCIWRPFGNNRSKFTKSTSIIMLSFLILNFILGCFTIGFNRFKIQNPPLILSTLGLPIGGQYSAIYSFIFFGMSYFYFNDSKPIHAPKGAFFFFNCGLS